jgi:hypothetical protein
MCGMPSCCIYWKRRLSDTVVSEGVGRRKRKEWEIEDGERERESETECESECVFDTEL